MRPLLTALLVLSTCAQSARKPSPLPCVTPCGMHYAERGEQCRALGALEAEIVATYADEVPEFRPASASCKMLQGWVVQVHQRTESDAKHCEEGAWFEGAPFFPTCVLGYTRFASHVVELGDADLRHGSLAHEIGHVLDHGYGTARGNHCGWDARGIKRACLRVTGNHDETVESCD